GHAGVRWLREIPRLLGEIEQAWELRIGSRYELSYNYVAPAVTGDGLPRVVKLIVPGALEFDREAAALAGFAGEGAVALLARDDSRGALLLERATPGRELAELGPGRDAEATAALCSVMQQLWREPPAATPLPHVTAYEADFLAYRRRHPTGGPLPQDLVDRAMELLGHLSSTADRTVLLHADLHHHNVLQAEREPWLAIDPHGRVGDPGFDVGPMLYNPVTLTAEQLRLLLSGRLDQLCAGTGLDYDRIVGWGLVMSIMSEIWSAEEDDEIDGRPLAVAQMLVSRL
ncbi:MAG: aminoglycoside phosphotransferase family protein, partial [Actinomycetota bacterium]|nr:aminoglycoside phosphotransferase family protein [Actinomycetota bacterium]